jgi:hypothetical protein
MLSHPLRVIEVTMKSCIAPAKPTLVFFNLGGISE